MDYVYNLAKCGWEWRTAFEPEYRRVETKLLAAISFHPKDIQF
jgi:hypothetical protein